MKHRINVSIALLLSCVLAASSNLVFASSISVRTATSRKTVRLPKHERLRVTRPVQTATLEGQTTTLLSDGRLLVVGGVGAEGTLSTAAINDPVTGASIPLANMGEARAWHSATVLPDGRVFIFGGVGVGGGALKSGEIFDPMSLSFTPLPSSGLTARAFHTATLLMDGKVLFVGGTGDGGKAAVRIETWDFKIRSAKALAARLNVARQKHKASLLADSRVLIEAGVDEVGTQVGAIEAFSPETGEFTLAGPVLEDNGAPYLAASLPVNDAVDVPVDSIVALRFSKLLSPRTVNAETIVLNSAEGRAYAKVVVAESGRMIFVSPLEPLEPNTSYTLTIGDEVNALTPATVTFKTADSQDRPNDQADQPDWVPDQNNLRGDWTIKSPKSQWQDLPRLEAEAGVTALSGQTLTLRGQPLANVTLEINGTRTTTDNTGRFLLKSLTAGHHVLKIDGSTATRPGGAYGIFRAGVDVSEGKTNALDYTIWLPRLDMANAITISSPTATDVSITTPRIPKLELRLPAQTLIRDLNGQPVTQLSITPIPTDRPPFPLPTGIHVPVFFTIQPGGSRVVPPRAQLIYPNFTNSPPGTRIDFWNYDPEGKGWYVYGQGTVNQNGSQIIPDPGVVLYEFSGTMVASPSNAPPEGPKPCNPASEMGDPVDTATGLYVHQKTDFIISDTLPIDLTRTYRPRDSVSRPFGIGMSHQYEMFLIGTIWPYTSVDLILPDGGRVHYDRVSPGTTFTDAVYEHNGSPSAFYKSRIRYIGVWELKLRDGTVYSFPDAEGALTPRQAALVGIRDRHGNQLTLTRNSNSELTRITTPNGRFLDFTYDTSSRITKAKDNIGREILYAYDTSGRLSQITDLNAGTTKYTYDTSNRMLTVEDRRGIVYVTNEYDTAGRIIKQTMADETPGNPSDNPIHQYAYVTDGSGRITQTDYTDPNGKVQRTTFNAQGYVATTTYGFGSSQAATLTYERQAVTNMLASVTDPRGRKTAYVYDTQGNILSITRLHGTPDAITTRYEYEPQFNNMTTVIDPLGRRISYGYDSVGRLTSVTDGQGRKVSITYNSAGQRETVTDQLQRIFRFVYEKGELVKIIDPLGRTVSRFTDGAGRLLAFTNALGQITRYEYDAFNQLTKIIDPINGTTEFTHDIGGRLTQVKDSRNKLITYTYDNMDRVLSRTDALQGATSVEQYEYDKAGNLTKVTDRRGKVTVYTYDALERRTFTGFGASGGTYESTINFTYDNGNRLREVVDSLSGTITLDVDELDSVTSVTTPQGTITYTNDEIGRRESMSVSGQPTVFYQYDQGDRVTSISRGSDVVSFVYDAVNQLIRTTQPNGVITDYDYDAASRLVGITYKLGSTVIGDLTYQYDAGGRRTVIGGTFARTNLPQPLGSSTYNDANRLTQRDSASFTYDANGNLTGDGTNTYTWNARNELTAVTGPGVNTTFQYDAFGRRVNKTVSGTSTTYLYDDLNVVRETTTSSTVDVLAFGLDQVFTRSDGTGSFGHLRDALGSTIALADSSGAVQTSYTYDPFGNTTVAGGGSSNSAQFTSRENDGSGLYYYRSRYYSPALGRFISEDPVGIAGGINLYAYVANDPVNFADPQGTWPSKLGVHVHQWSADRMLSDRLSPQELEMLKQGLKDADASEYQDVEDSYRHAMTGNEKSKTDARKKANDFVRDELNQARNANNAADAMKHLSNAMHAMQDATSPAHADFRKYSGWMDMPSHLVEEFFDPYYGSNLDKATEMAYKYYTGELPMPQDFFENLCTDNHPMKPR